MKNLIDRLEKIALGLSLAGLISGCATSKVIPLIQQSRQHIANSNDLCNTRRSFLPEKEHYIELFIKEEKIGGRINFLLDEIRELHGDHESLIIKDLPGTYEIKIYRKEEVIAKYPLASARLIYHDGGKLVEQKEGIINVIIPYYEGISKISILYNRGEKELPLKLESR